MRLKKIIENLPVVSIKNFKNYNIQLKICSFGAGNMEKSMKRIIKKLIPFILLFFLISATAMASDFPDVPRDNSEMSKAIYILHDAGEPFHDLHGPNGTQSSHNR